MADDVEIKGRIIHYSQDETALLFRPEAPVFVPAVWLDRDKIAVVQEPGEFVKVTMPYWLAMRKGLEGYA